MELVIDHFALTFIFSECLCDKCRAICKSVLRQCLGGKFYCIDRYSNRILVIRRRLFMEWCVYVCVCR